jgi:hypothetical protein
MIIEAVAVVTIKNTVFQFVAPCNLIEVYWHFRGTYCLPLQGIREMPYFSTKYE